MLNDPTLSIHLLFKPIPLALIIAIKIINIKMSNRLIGTFIF